MKLGSNQQGNREDSPLDFREAAPSASSLAGKIGAKNLLIVIVTMPFVFLLVVMAIISIFGRPDDAVADVARVVRSAPVATEALEEPASAGPQRVVLPIPASVDGAAGGITLPAGAQAGAMSLDGDRLALRVETGDGAVIVIYDLATDQVVKTIPLVEGSDG